MVQVIFNHSLYIHLEHDREKITKVFLADIHKTFDQSFKNAPLGYHEDFAYTTNGTPTTDVEDLFCQVILLLAKQMPCYANA